MTGKERVQKGWETLSARSAGIFIVAGMAGLVLAHSFADMLAWLKDPAVAGLIVGLAQKTLKKTGEDVTTQIFERLGAQQLQIDDGKREHGECMQLHEQAKQENARIWAAFGQMGNPGMGS